MCTRTQICSPHCEICVDIYEVTRNPPPGFNSPMIVTSQHPLNSEQSMKIEAARRSTFLLDTAEKVSYTERITEEMDDRPSTCLDLCMETRSTVVLNNVVVGVVAHHKQLETLYESDNPVARYLFKGLGFAVKDVKLLLDTVESGVIHLTPEHYTYRDNEVISITEPKT